MLMEQEQGPFRVEKASVHHGKSFSCQNQHKHKEGPPEKTPLPSTSSIYLGRIYNEK